jgi:glutamate dehydrogenase/leucine dehydrogenase
VTHRCVLRRPGYRSSALKVFERISGDGHETVCYCHDRATGLRAVIAIHSTALGPALGGVRFRTYDDEDAAVEDVLRLSKAMSYKNAAAGLDLGGGKAVILGDPAAIKTDELMRAYGRFVDGLNGRYLTAEDVGTTQHDMDVIREVTRHVTGVDPARGGSGDPSPATALGVFEAMRAVALHLWGEASMAGRRVTVSGVGKVGSDLVRHLVSAGATVAVSDVNEGAVAALVQELGVEVVAVDKAHTVDCDIFSPCALGAALNATTIPQLRCAAVVGAANNQLATPEDAERLRQADVAFAPDFIVNAGGVINIAEELHDEGYDRERAMQRVRRIHETTLAVLRRAEQDGVTTEVAAERLAEERWRNPT